MGGSTRLALRGFNNRGVIDAWLEIDANHPGDLGTSTPLLSLPACGVSGTTTRLSQTMAFSMPSQPFSALSTLQGEGRFSG